MACCVFNFALTPFFECLLEAGCTDPNTMSSFTGLYSRSLCVTCFVSYAVAWRKRGTALAVYRERLAAHDARWPAAAAERRRHAAVRCAVTAACLALTVPVNAARLYILYTSGIADRSLLVVFFAVMYVINISVCMLETRFVGLCYAVYLKFAAVNRDLDDIEGAIADDGCPPCRNGPDVARRRRVRVARDEDVYYCSIDSGAGRPLVEAVEELRVRHRLVRQAMAELNDAYAVPVGMTLCTLCIMTLFDMYYHMTSLETSSKTSLFIYVWLLQYGFRFFVIVKTAHATTKQVGTDNGCDIIRATYSPAPRPSETETVAVDCRRQRGVTLGQVGGWAVFRFNSESVVKRVRVTR
ncbi:7TM chemoreceptor [Cinara cedri]|uniref:Gustatory receptor n=1 Tax=Cinara cedri TaxID=506608 RepID=A0A5E4NIQ2_9HEMI|nr:7TM chemoreceptor [Cinara cedri]